MKNRKAKIAIISRESDEKSTDIAMLEKALQDKGAEVKTLCRLLRKERSLRSLSYAGEILRQIRAIYSSDVVVLDTYCIPVSMLPQAGRAKAVQMWHALSAVKKFGWQTVGRAGGSSERTARIMRMHRGYDRVVSCSDITAAYFCEAFRTGRDKIMKAGLPRIDLIRSIVSSGREETAAKIYRKYPQLDPEKQAERGRRKKLVLYAPTFRNGAPADVRGLAENIDRDSFDMVVKLHPLDRLSAEQPVPEGVVTDRSFDSYDWLAAADIIISDYSSFVVEATLAEKPLYIYAYDLEDYSEKVGLNMDFDAEPIAPYVFRDAAKLGAALKEGYDTGLLAGFRKRYIDIETENCTEKLADMILELAGESRRKK